MALSRDFKETVVERAQADPAFALALWAEALDLFLNGESKAARLALRILVNATIGFEELSRKTNAPPKSLHRMLSPRGNPRMDNLAVILEVLKQHVERKAQNNTRRHHVRSA